MNLAEDKRNARISALDDGKLLEIVLKTGDLSESEIHAFADMKAGMEHFEVESGRVGTLTRKQRSWLEEVARRVLPITAAEVPRGKEVADPPSLRRENLPLKPPGRR